MESELPTHFHVTHHILGHAFNKIMESGVSQHFSCCVLELFQCQVVFSTTHRSFLLDIASTTSVGYLVSFNADSRTSDPQGKESSPCKIRMRKMYSCLKIYHFACLGFCVCDAPGSELSTWVRVKPPRSPGCWSSSFPSSFPSSVRVVFT